LLLEATRTVPIVFAIVGNATGFMMFDYSLSGKWLELLKQVVPGLTQAAVLRDSAAGVASLR